MGKRPPHILVTTPESLFILLTAEGSRRMLRTTRTVIVDEIHAMADDKRGSHLALSLARLDALVEGPKPQRIGLSATVKPIEEVAQFLSQRARISQRWPPPRHGAGGRSSQRRTERRRHQRDVGARSTTVWPSLIRANRTTLVFVNTRRLAERVSHALSERLGENAVLPHHGSLSRALRFEAEVAPEERRVCAPSSRRRRSSWASTSARWIWSARSARRVPSPSRCSASAGPATGWARMPKGRIFATTRDELVECAALMRAIREGELDRMEIPHGALDILAQQIVAAAATGDWQRRRPVRAGAQRIFLSRSANATISTPWSQMLSDGIATQRGRSGAFLHRDRDQRPRARTPRRAPGGHHVRRRDPGERELPGRRRARRHHRRYARRRLRRREPGGRRLPAGHALLAHPARGSRDACAWRMRMAPRRRFPSGWAKRPAAPRSCRAKFRGCGKTLLRARGPKPSNF